MFTVLLSVFLVLVPVFAESVEPAHLQLETDQAPESVHPRVDSLAYRIFLRDQKGQALPQARLKIHLKAPETPWLGSTDFPVVEGSSLLNQDLEVHGGEHFFQIVPPIRGTYTLTASVEPLPGDTSFTATENTWSTTIEESPARKKNLAVLLAILVTIGGASGFVFGRSAKASAAAALLFLLMPYQPLKAHGSHDHAKIEAPPAETITNSAGHHIEMDITTPEPKVGELTSLIARYQNAQGQLQGARFHLEVMQLEHQQLVFSSDVTAPDGILRWQGQFFDGSPHRVMLTAEPLLDNGSTDIARLERDVAVSSVEPPLRSVVKSLGLLLTITALALIGGILLGRSLPLKKSRFT